jgi:response regulator of citrate/malate metabolism
MYYKVLIVEDDPMVSMINEQYVNRNKAFRVVGTCKDGKSALAYLENNDVDLIVLDVYMPLMDGFETLRQI